MSKNSTDAIVKAIDSSNGDEDTKKIWLDHAFREYLTKEIMKKVDLKKCDKYIELSINAATQNLCNKTTPIQVLSDMFDIITLAQCEVLFGTIEKNIAVWKSADFFPSIKNNLLRICNG